jgi:nucleotide-binding universal stress UspA family protein
MQGEQILNKILVPIDNSVPSLIAQELTAFIAKRLNSKVTVLHVVSHEFMNLGLQKFFKSDRHQHVLVGPEVQSTTSIHVDEPPMGPLSERVSQEILNWYHQKGEKAIADAVALFKEEGVPVDKKLVEHADPATTILNEAKEGSYNLVVMAPSEEEEQKPHLGGTAEKVTRHAEIPVLIARGKRQISKILVPLDGSENGQRAFEYAVSLAGKTNSKVSLLYVQESSIFNLRPQVTKELGKRVLSDAVKQLEGKKIEVDQKLESGDPAKKIVEVADKAEYDLIVMGSRGLGAIGRFLLGSVSDHVGHYANRSVLIVK